MRSEAAIRASTLSFGHFRRAWNYISAFLSLIAILLYLSLRYLLHGTGSVVAIPLWVAVLVGSMPLLVDLVRKALKRQFGSDFLAGLSIVTATLMGELLVATIIVLMLSGGQALEEFAELNDQVSKNLTQVSLLRISYDQTCIFITS